MAKNSGYKHNIYEIELIFSDGKILVVFWRFDTYGISHKIYRRISRSSLKRLEHALNSGVFAGESIWRTILDTDQNKVRYIRK